MNIKNVIFVAPPAAGKGTIAKMLSDKYNMPHISTGDLLRGAIDDSERGKMLSDLLSKGMMISDEIVLELLKERLSKDDCNSGYILDGFPRNVKQAESYDQILKEIGKDIGCVIYFDVDKEEAKKRIIGRVSCPKCGSVYNELIEGKQPKVKGICDVCGETLVKRSDDTAEVYETRYNVYVNETFPLVDYYKNQNVLFTVDSNKGQENTFSQIEDIIKGE